MYGQPQGVAVQIRARTSQVAALESDMWARNAGAAIDGRKWQVTADAAVQAALDVGDAGPREPEVGLALVKSMAAVRAGTAGRF